MSARCSTIIFCLYLCKKKERLIHVLTLWSHPSPSQTYTQTYSSLLMDECVRTKASTFAHPADTWWIEHFFRAKHSSTHCVISPHFGRGMCAPVPLHLTSSTTRHHPTDPWDALFSLIFLDIPLHFSCENAHLLPTSIRPGKSVMSLDEGELKCWQPFMDFYVGLGHFNATSQANTSLPTFMVGNHLPTKKVWIPQRSVC